MNYKETPPANIIDRRFVDDMVNELITLIGNRELLFSKVMTVELLEPCSDTYVAIEELYSLLSQTDCDMEQVCYALRMKVGY
jgi:hypothetical protein